MLFILYKPISPHISIYKIQSCSIYSILHRISGFLISLIIILSFFYFSIHLNICYINIFYIFFKYNFFIFINFLYLSIIILKLYHIIRGIIHIYNSFGFNYK